MRIGIMSASVEGKSLRENRRLMEEIEELNHEPVLINYRKAAVGISVEGRSLYQYDADDIPVPVDVDAVIPRIGKYVESGRAVLTLLMSQGVYSTASPEAVVNAKDKINTLTILDSRGIPVPYSVAPTGIKPKDPTATLKVIQPEYKEPIIIKTIRGSHGEGVVLAESRRSAKSQAQAFQAHRIGYLIQEFVEAPEKDSLASDVRLFVVEGITIAAMRRRAKDKEEFRSNLSQEGEGEFYEPTSREKELAAKACEALGVTVGGVDILQSDRGPLVNEVNVSPEFGIEAVTGVNVARAIAELAVHNSIKEIILPRSKIETIEIDA
jgi:ribosomal protein S6--L-glutamate ligase